MIFLPDTNACIALLRGDSLRLLQRWRETPVQQMVMCSVVVYELRYGAARCSRPEREQALLDEFLAPFTSLPFDDACAGRCAMLRRELEQAGEVIGPHDLQIAAVALQHSLTLVTHNTREFSRVRALRLEDWES